MKGTLLDLGTGKVLQEVRDKILPNRSRFGFYFVDEERYSLEDNLTHLWKMTKTVLQRLVIFVQEHGPLPTDCLQIILRLLVSALLQPTYLLEAESHVQRATTYLGHLILNHKLRSKKPICGRNDEPFDSYRTLLEHSSF